MTEQGALAEQDLTPLEADATDDDFLYQESGDDYLYQDGGDVLYQDGGYVLYQDGDDIDGPIDDWDYYTPPPSPAAPAKTRWFRSPRWLFALIALAAAALVVASVLLVTGRQSGEIPTAPQLSVRTSPGVTPTMSRRVPSPSSEPASASASASAASASASSPSTTAPEPPSETPGAELVPGPALPGESAPPAAVSPSQSKSPAGPRINVTRTPMSFTPGKH